MNVLAPQEYKAAQKLNNQSTITPEELDVLNSNPDKWLTPDQMLQKKFDDAMQEAVDGGYSADAPYSQPAKGGNSALQFINRIKDDLNFKHDAEIKMERLTPRKQIQINKLAEAINGQKDLWNEYYSAGLLDRPFDEAWVNGVNDARVHPDDIVEWMNSATTRKTGAKLGTPGPLSMLKDQRGAIGGGNPRNPDIRGSSALSMLGLTATTGLGALTALEAAKRKKANSNKGRR
jgi:hypothetical protein